MKKISVVTPTYNEQDNVAGVVEEIRKVFRDLPQYDYEHLFIDNASHDRTVEILKGYAAQDQHIKIIVNTRNFGITCSPHHAVLQTSGDAVTVVVADLQDPPDLIKDFIRKWEEGYKIVIGIKSKSEENWIMFTIRKVYYSMLKKFADVEMIKNFNGYGLYDRTFIDILRQWNDPYPYFRGLVAEVGFPRAELVYTQAARKKGMSSSSFYKLYEIGMLGFVSHSKVPLRLASFIGFGVSVISFIFAIIYLVRKLLLWDSFELGLAPLVIGLFFFGSIQLFFIGIIGEYIGWIYTQVKHRPLVVEKERINF